MELDSRIIEGKKPLTCFDIDEAEKYVGQKCYISNEYDFYRNLDFTQQKILNGVEDCEEPFHYDQLKQAKFCLPCEWVKESEKKWRPYTGIEFAEKFDLWIGHVIRIRDRPENAGQEYEYKIMFVGYRWYKGMFEVFINGCWIDLLTLFELYEYMEDGEWHKFGVEE